MEVLTWHARVKVQRRKLLKRQLKRNKRRLWNG